MERSILKLRLSNSVWWPLLYRTEHFSRGKTERKGAQKREGRGGGQQRGEKGKKEKRTRENRSVKLLQRVNRGRGSDLQHGSKTLTRGIRNGFFFLGGGGGKRQYDPSPPGQILTPGTSNKIVEIMMES